MNLTHEQVRRLEDKDVTRHYKRYETYVGAKTTETLIESFLSLSTKAIGMVVRLKDAEALKNELKKRLHHYKGAFCTVRQSCAEMWPFARSGKRVSDRGKKC